MIKKLLNHFLNISYYENERKKIENYLAQSSDLADLEYRIKELDQSGTYNIFYI